MGTAVCLEVVGSSCCLPPIRVVVYYYKYVCVQMAATIREVRMQEAFWGKLFGKSVGLSLNLSGKSGNLVANNEMSSWTQKCRKAHSVWSRFVRSSDFRVFPGRFVNRFDRVVDKKSDRWFHNPQSHHITIKL